MSGVSPAIPFTPANSPAAASNEVECVCDLLPYPITDKIKEKLRTKPVEDWLPLIRGEKLSDKKLFHVVKSTVEDGEWAKYEELSQFVIRACAEIRDKKIDPSLAKRFERMLRVQRAAESALLKSKETPASLEPKALTSERPQFQVMRLSDGNCLEKLQSTLKEWRQEMLERVSLARTLQNMKLLTKEDKDIIEDSNQVIGLTMQWLPKVASDDWCAYICLDEKQKISAMAMRKYEGCKGYHLRYPITAPKNIAILNGGQLAQRGAMTAIVTKMAEDILLAGKRAVDGSISRLYCEPVDSAVPFYKKLGFALPKYKGIELSLSDCSDSDISDSDVSAGESSNELELDAAAMQALVDKQKAKNASALAY